MIKIHLLNEPCELVAPFSDRANELANCQLATASELVSSERFSLSDIAE